MTTVTADAALSDGREHLYRMMMMSTQQPQNQAQSFGSSAWSSYCAELGPDVVARKEKKEHSIPTAIVKPKYQKIPHDDRQLLTNAGGYVDYNLCANTPNHNHNNNNSSSSNKRVHNNKLQAAFEEATRKKSSALAALRRDNNNRSHSSSSSASSAIVGVVTPRKKNYNEHRSPGHNQNNNLNMNGEWEREMCLGGGGGGSAGAGYTQKATDFNENNVISDKNNGRPASAIGLMKRSSGRRKSSARENAG